MPKVLRQVSGTITETVVVPVKIQVANPNLTENGMWWELNNDLTLKTLWVETGF